MEMVNKIAILLLIIAAVAVIVKATSKSIGLFNRQPIKRTKATKVKGIVFGHKGLFKKIIYSPTDDEGHILVIGGSGSGKTSAVLIPTLQKWSGTSFVVDISGDISTNVNCQNKLIYEPMNSQTIPFNIFAAIDCIEDEAEQDEALEQLAFLLLPELKGNSDTGRFFNNEGRKILTAALIAFYHKGADFIPLCERFVASSWLVLFEQIKATKNKKAIMFISSFEGANEQNTSGCKQAADAALKLFATNEKVKSSIRRPTENEDCFTPNKLNNYNVFIVIPDDKLELFAPLLHIITAQTLNFMSARSNKEKETILFCLDEFASLGKLEITPALRKLRKKKIRIMVLTQSLADLDLIYGKDERTAMLNNFNFKLILAATDVETQEYFSKLAGTHTTKRETENKSGSGFGRTNSTSYTYIDEPNIKPAEFSNLKNKLVLLYSGGYTKLGKHYYFKERPKKR